MSRESLPREDAAKVGVIVEADAEHVEDFAFAPFAAGPEVADGVDVQGRVIDDAGGIERRAQEGFDDEPLGGGGVDEVVNDGEAAALRGAGFAGRVVEIIDGSHIDEQVVGSGRIVAKEGHHIMDAILGHHERGLSAELGGEEFDIGELRLDERQRGMVEGGSGHGSFGGGGEQ